MTTIRWCKTHRRTELQPPLSGTCVRSGEPWPAGKCDVATMIDRDTIDYEAAENIIGPITSSGFSGKYLPEVVRQAVDAALGIGGDE